MLVGVERLPHRNQLFDAVAAENAFQLASGRFEACHQPLELLILAQIRRDRLQRTAKIIRNGQHVAREGRRRIGARVRQFLFQPSPHILRFGMGVKRILLRRRQFAFQGGQALCRSVPGGRRVLGQFVNDFGILDIQLVFAHLINLDNVCAVKSTMGITRA